MCSSVQLLLVVVYVSQALLIFVSIKPGETKKNVARKTVFVHVQTFCAVRNKHCPKLCDFSKATSYPLQRFVLKFCYQHKQ